MLKMLYTTINGRSYFTINEISILEACKFIGIQIPRFCYHENLSIAGNCRMCLVEVDKIPKPVAACAILMMDNMVINTSGPFVLKARENILEFLLINHPLDCPICDQGGECDLQDQAMLYGSNFSRSYFNKRGVEDKYCGPLIKTIMVRCIHCTRCVRFGNEICGVKLLGTLNRGSSLEIGNYVTAISFSEISVNIVDLCPVGALTLKPSVFQVRPWELKTIESIDLSDGLGSNIYINYKELDIIRILPKKNIKINESWISDKARFAFVNKSITFEDNFSYKTLLASFHTNVLKKSLLLIINSDIDLQTLSLFQQLSFLSRGKIKIKSCFRFKIFSNSYIWAPRIKVQDLSIIKSSILLFLSLNLAVESALINTRVRSNLFSYGSKLFTYGYASSINLTTLCIKLSTKSLMLLFIGKYKNLSSLFLKNKVIIFYGKSVVDRFDKYNFDVVKNRLPNLIFYKIQTLANAEGSTYFNISSGSANNFKKAAFIYNFFIEDSNFIRHQLLLYPSKFSWFNNAFSEITSNSPFFCLDLSNSGGIYLNLEQRPQTANDLLNFANYTQVLDFFLTSFIEKLQGLIFVPAIFSTSVISQNFSNSRTNLLACLKIFINFPELFEKKLLVNFLYNETFPVYKNNFYSFYPVKPIITDFFRTSTLSKNSIYLTKCSQEMRKNEYNFDSK